MSERIKVIDCAGLGWLALWTFLIWLTLNWGIVDHLESIAESQRQIAASCQVASVEVENE